MQYDDEAALGRADCGAFAPGDGPGESTAVRRPESTAEKVGFISRLGDFIRTERGPDGNDWVFYCSPEDVRPAHWMAKRRLPATGKRDGCPYAASTAARIMRDIEVFDSQIEAFNKRGRLSAPGGDRSVSALAELYRMEERKTKTYAALVPASKERVDFNIAKIERWSEDNGSPSFAEIGQAELNELLQLYDDRPSQKVQMRVALSHLLQTAKLCGWREDNPMDHVRVRQPELPQRDFWSQADIANMIKGANELGYASLAGVIEFLSETGQRYRDVIKMRHGHEYADGYLWFRQGKRAANIAGLVQNRLIAMVESLRLDGSDFLFNRPGTSLPFTTTSLTYQFDKVRAHVHQEGDTWLTLQTLRHTCVVKLISDGVHPYTIAAMTGHKYKSIDQIMERYGIRTADAAMQALKALNRANGGQDEDFGEYKPSKAGFKPRGQMKRHGDVGLRRRRARQFLNSYLERAELDELFTNRPEDGVRIAEHFRAKLS